MRFCAKAKTHFDFGMFTSFNFLTGTLPFSLWVLYSFFHGHAYSHTSFCLGCTSCLESSLPWCTSSLHLIFVLYLHWFGGGGDWWGWLSFIKPISFFRQCVGNLHALFNNTHILQMEEQRLRDCQWAHKE